MAPLGVSFHFLIEDQGLVLSAHPGPIWFWSAYVVSLGYVILSKVVPRPFPSCYNPTIESPLPAAERGLKGVTQVMVLYSTVISRLQPAGPLTFPEWAFWAVPPFLHSFPWDHLSPPLHPGQLSTLSHLFLERPLLSADWLGNFSAPSVTVPVEAQFSSTSVSLLSSEFFEVIWNSFFEP